MNRINMFIGMSFISSLIAVIVNCIGKDYVSYSILLALIVIDSFTGMAVSLKYSRFSSKGLVKLLKKIITYSTAIFTVRLLEIGIVPIVNTSMMSHIVVIFLEITEVISILENLTLLGVPLPASFISFLLKYLKIPGLNSAIKLNKSKEKDVDEIEDMIRYHIPAFNDSNIRKLLEIKFECWKSLVFEINKLFKEIDTDDNNHIYFKVMSLIELEFKDMKDKWKEAKIPKESIDIFMSTHQSKIDKWLEKVKEICYSYNTIDKKRKDLIDSIIVILYQTILDAHRIYNS